MRAERSRALADKEALEKSYEALMREHQNIQTKLEEAVASKDDTIGLLRQARKELDDRRIDRADASMRAEIDRLRTDL